MKRIHLEKIKSSLLSKKELEQFKESREKNRLAVKKTREKPENERRRKSEIKMYRGQRVEK